MRATYPARRLRARLMAPAARGSASASHAHAARPSPAASRPPPAGRSASRSTSWSYMWRTTPMHRREEIGALADDRAARRCRAGVSREEVQAAADGAGPALPPPLRALVREPRLSPEELDRRTSRTTSTASRPTEFAVFQKVAGRDERDARRRRVRRADARAVGRPGARGRGRRRARSASPRSPATSRPARSSSAPRRRRRACASRSSRGRAAATACRTCSTTACAWPRRSSCTCGPRSSSASRGRPGGRLTGGIEIHTRRVEDGADEA